jgi:hypothetical protein
MCRCGGAAEHEHLLDPNAIQTRSLYEYILVTQCTALNIGNGYLDRVLARAFNKQDPLAFIKSDCDDQLIVQVKFSGAVKIKSIQLALGPEYGPSDLCVFCNQTIDFSSLEDGRKKATQEFKVINDLASHQENVIEYPLKAHLFGNVSSLTLLFKNQNSIHSQVRFIGFTGDFVNSKAAPIITQYELKPQIADHKNETDWQTAGKGNIH